MEIKQITAKKTHPLRKKFLRKGTTLPIVFDGDDAHDTFHLGAFQGEELVAVATFVAVTSDLLPPAKQYQLRGMATLKKIRGQGFGKALIKKALYLLKEKEVFLLWCNARVSATDFYKKIGFKIVGAAFEVPQIGTHYKMFLDFK